MIDLIFSGVFIVTAMIFAIAAMFLTEKIKDMTNLQGREAGYILSFICSAIVTYGTKFLGTGGIFTILVTLGYTGEVPTIPPEASAIWAYWIILHVAAFLVSGGIYDWRKLAKG